jgi:threonine dehydrogenase-like Zn-dependent dehydrogenase
MTLMRAVVWQGPRKVAVETVPDPRIEEPTDAVIRVTASGICGSDLHLYDHGATMMMRPGDILGHEPMGVVEEVGSGVTHIKPGDTVVVPFNIACGHCFMCDRELYSQCETTQSMGGRRGGALFGWTHMYGGVPGGQAEYLRVPQAHFGPLKVEAGLPESALLLLSDVLPTSWQAVEYAAIPPEGTVVVYGLGPIGQMCCRVARHRGAGRVIGVDRYLDRLKTASEYGVETVDYTTVDDIVETVREMTGGRGADSVIDAVGMDAEGSIADRVFQATKMQPDRMAALHQSLGSARRGGTVSVIGVYFGWMARFPVGDLFDKQITLRWGQANVRRWTGQILDVLREGDPIDAAALVTTRVPLAEAPDAYTAFRDKEPGVIKVMLLPQEG